MEAFKLLLVLIAVSQAQVQWFKVPESRQDELFASSLDFRGCYGSACFYLAESAAFESELLHEYRAGESAWAVGLHDASVQLVFSENKPDDQDAVFVSPVSDHTVKKPHFDASQYSTDHNPEVQKFVDSIKEERLQKMVEDLSETFHTRNSLSHDAVQASEYIEKLLEELNCQGIVRTGFKSGYSPNVVCYIPGALKPSEYVVLGAHYDDRAGSSTNTTSRAPGADDNGTGTSALLDILWVAHKHKFSFERSLMFAFFSGEEQGLLGSKALAETLVKNKTISLHAMINMDMIGYPQKGSENTLYWMNKATTPSLTTLAMDLTKVYLGAETQVKTTPGCCSDQQSFHKHGVPSASIFEALSGTNNPNYHKSSDTTSTVDFAHVERNTKAVSALIATVAVVHKSE